MADRSIAIAIYSNRIILGEREYAPGDEVDPSLMAIMRPALADELNPRESRARIVAEAICALHEKAMQACLMDDQTQGA